MQLLDLIFVFVSSLLTVYALPEVVRIGESVFITVPILRILLFHFLITMMYLPRQLSHCVLFSQVLFSIRTKISRNTLFKKQSNVSTVIRIYFRDVNSCHKLSLRWKVIVLKPIEKVKGT
jgi:hypothetical protein